MAKANVVSIADYFKKQFPNHPVPVGRSREDILHEISLVLSERSEEELEDILDIFHEHYGE